jgi:YaiO family outer membrane protein
MSTARAEEPPAVRVEATEIGLTYARETLSTHPAAWTDTTLEAAHAFAPRKLLAGRITRSERFGLSDDTFALSGYVPLAERTTGYAEIGLSGTHRVLPRHSVHLQLTQSLGQGWGLLGGFKHVSYNATDVRIGELTVERYFGAYRVAASLYPSHSSTAGNASSYRIQLSRYYGSENAIQVLYVGGVEVDRPTAVDTVLATKVRSVALFGRHWLTREWALTYGLAHTVQGNGTRHAANVGVRLRF